MVAGTRFRFQKISLVRETKVDAANANAIPSGSGKIHLTRIGHRLKKTSAGPATPRRITQPKTLKETKSAVKSE